MKVSTWERRERRRRIAWWCGAGLGLVAIAVIIWVAIAADRSDREDCEANGGAVVEVRNSKYGEWVCLPPERAP